MRECEVCGKKVTIRAYWNEIKFKEAELSYRGTDFDFEEDE